IRTDDRNLKRLAAEQHFSRHVLSRANAVVVGHQQHVVEGQSLNYVHLSITSISAVDRQLKVIWLKVESYKVEGSGNSPYIKSALTVINFQPHNLQPSTTDQPSLSTEDSQSLSPRIFRINSLLYGISGMTRCETEGGFRLSGRSAISLQHANSSSGLSATTSSAL